MAAQRQKIVQAPGAEEATDMDADDSYHPIEKVRTWGQVALRFSSRTLFI